MESRYESLSGYGAPPSDKIARIMSIEKPQYRLSKPKTGFNIKAMNNPSEFIQRKAGIPEDEIVPFDKAQAAENIRRRKSREAKRLKRRIEELVERYSMDEEEAERQASMEVDIHKAAQRPEYWGLSWDDLKPVYGKKQGTNTINKNNIRYYITKDNVRFPPVKWKSGKSGRIFEALAEYVPEGGDRQRTRYTKLYFRDNDDLDEGVLMNKYTLPVEDDLYEFGKSFLRKFGKETDPIIDDEFIMDNKELLEKTQEKDTIEVDGSTKLVPIQEVTAFGPQKSRALAAKRKKTS